MANLFWCLVGEIFAVVITLAICRVIFDALSCVTRRQHKWCDSSETTSSAQKQYQGIPWHGSSPLKAGRDRLTSIKGHEIPCGIFEHVCRYYTTRENPAQPRAKINTISEDIVVVLVLVLFAAHTGRTFGCHGFCATFIAIAFGVVVMQSRYCPPPIESHDPDFPATPDRHSLETPLQTPEEHTELDTPSPNTRFITTPATPDLRQRRALKTPMQHPPKVSDTPTRRRGVLAAPMDDEDEDDDDDDDDVIIATWRQQRDAGAYASASVSVDRRVQEEEEKYDDELATPPHPASSDSTISCSGGRFHDRSHLMKVIKREINEGGCPKEERVLTPRKTQNSIVSAVVDVASKVVGRGASKDTQRESIRDFLSRCHLQEVDIKGDGHCQFRAISYQLWGNQENFLQVRRDIGKQLRKHKDLYSESVYDMTFDDFVNYMEFQELSVPSDHYWGDHLSLRAAADFYGVTFYVLHWSSATLRPSYHIIGPGDNFRQNNCWEFALCFYAEIHYNTCKFAR